jgi:hypothetical protein
MELPLNPSIPFFAYGLFRPGQIAYFQIRDYVQSRNEPSFVKGELRVRDGLPILDSSGNGTVEGVVLRFIESEAVNAYERIAGLEPEKQYRWDTTSVDNVPVNILLGISPRLGSAAIDDGVWDGWNDPLLTSALDVVQETIDSNADFDWNLKPLFRLQMAYLLLWSSIERYLSLRYHLANKANLKVNHLAHELAFINAVSRYVSEKRSVTRADRPRDKSVLDPASPSLAVDYYYQVRSNITHRGKGLPRDHDTMLKSAMELLQIFRDVVIQAKIDAQA